MLLLSRLGEASGHVVSIADFFLHPTGGYLAGRLGSGGARDALRVIEKRRSWTPRAAAPLSL